MQAIDECLARLKDASARDRLVRDATRREASLIRLGQHDLDFQVLHLDGEPARARELFAVIEQLENSLFEVPK